MIQKELKGIYYIALKDMRAYYFKPPNISWGILFPFVFTLAFYLKSPVDFEKLIPGLLSLSLLFGATSMEAIVITFERMTGALQRLMLYPVSITSIVSGKILGGALFGITVTSAMFAGLLLFFPVKISDYLLLIVSAIVSSLTFSALGAFVSVAVKQVFEAQTLANFFRFPMIFLSGVFIPVSSLPIWIKPIAYLLPLTYSVDTIRVSFGYQPEIFHPLLSLAILMIFTVVLLMLSVRILKNKTS